MPLPLPQEVRPPVHLPTVRLSVIGIVVVMIASNFAAMAFIKKFNPNEGYAVIHKKWDLLEANKEKIDVLVLGDSSISQGVDTNRLGAALGGRGLNVATTGDMTTVNDYLQLKYFLAHNEKPKLVVIGHVYDVWTREISGTMLAELPQGFGELGESLTPLGIDMGSKTLDYNLAKYVPLYTQNHSIVRGAGIALLARHRKSRISRIDASGFLHEDKAAPKEVEGDIEIHEKYIQRGKPEFDDSNLRALEATLKLANDNGIPVVFCNAPLSEDLYKEEAFQKFYAQVTDKIRPIVEKNPMNHYLFAAPVTFPKTELQNVDHLIESGAEQYTDAIITEIKKLGY